MLSIHPADFFPHIDSKKDFTLIKHTVTKFSVASSVQYMLSFITSFLKEMFSPSRLFLMRIILYYGIIRAAKSGLESAWISGYDSQNKDKNITITENKSLLFFQCSVS